MSPTSRALSSKVRRGIFGSWGAAQPAAPPQAQAASSGGHPAALAARAAPGQPQAARVPSRLASAPVTSWQMLSDALPEAEACAFSSSVSSSSLAAAAPCAAAAALAPPPAALPPRSPEPKHPQRLAARAALLSGQKEQEAGGARAAAAAAPGSAGRAARGGLALACANAGQDGEGAGACAGGSGARPGRMAAPEEDDAMGLIPVRRGIDGAALPDVALSCGGSAGLSGLGAGGWGLGAAVSEASGSGRGSSAAPIFSSPAGWETFESGTGPLLGDRPGGASASGSGSNPMASPRGLTLFR